MASNQKLEALLAILHRSYEEIRMLEAPYGLVVNDEDLRPRIEYFHDAVRVLSQDPEAMYMPSGRLSVEQLAYDLAALRRVQEKPMIRIDGTLYRRARSNNKGVMDISGKALAVETPNPEMNNNLRSDLSTQYKTYVVMFAALFAEPADRNFKTREEAHDSAVEDLAEVQSLIKQAMRGQINEQAIEDAIDMVQDPKLRHNLMAVLHQARIQKQQKFANLHQFISDQIVTIDVLTASMNKAHMSYLSGQMVLLQDSQSLVKKLAAQGMNLAGQFLESAMQGAGRGQGRGF